MIDATKLRELLTYDKDRGRFIANVTRGEWKNGNEVGSLHRSGYRVIRIFGVRYMEHRLVWIYHHEVISKKEIDHINGNKEDNRIENLRQATRSENAMNVHSARKDSKSGFKGAHRENGKWSARIKIDGKYKHLGSFTSPEEASSEYTKEKIRIGILQAPREEPGRQ